MGHLNIEKRGRRKRESPHWPRSRLNGSSQGSRHTGEMMTVASLRAIEYPLLFLGTVAPGYQPPNPHYFGLWAVFTWPMSEKRGKEKWPANHDQTGIKYAFFSRIKRIFLFSFKKLLKRRNNIRGVGPLKIAFFLEARGGNEGRNSHAALVFVVWHLWK